MPDKEVAVRAFGDLYLTPGTEIAVFARSCIEAAVGESSTDRLMVAVAVLGVISLHISRGRGPVDADAVRKTLRAFDMMGGQMQAYSRIEDAFDFDKFSSITIATNWKSFDTSAWKRVRSAVDFDF